MTTLCLWCSKPAVAFLRGLECCLAHKSDTKILANAIWFLRGSGMPSAPHRECVEVLALQWVKGVTWRTPGGPEPWKEFTP